jgi:ribosomal protein S18 acetylase RimI-like enzyme
MGFSVRPYAEADADAVAELLNSVERHTGGTPRFSGPDMRESMPSHVDLEQDTRMVIAPDCTPAAYGVAQAPSPGGTRAGAYGAVAPQWRGHGLGRDLLAWQLDRVGLIYRSAAPGVDWTVNSVANAADGSAVHLFERFGMAPQHELLHMHAPAESAGSAVSLDRLRVETVADVDAETLYRTHMSIFGEDPAYQQRPIEDWLRTSLRSAEFRPDLSRIAYDEAGIVGYVLGYDDIEPDKFYIGQVGTRADARGRGYAFALVSDALAAAAGAGKRTVRLNVDANNPSAIRVYRNAGFVVTNRILSYARAVTPA